MSQDVPVTKSKRGGARPGAGAPAKPLNAQAQEVLENWHPAFRRLMERLKTMGLSTRMAIFELHARQGRRLTDVASIMGLDLSTVYIHWNAIKADIAERATKTPEELATVREIIAMRLQGTIEDTYPEMEDEIQDFDADTGEEVKKGKGTHPAMLAVRLKALDQLAKLYGVNMEAQVNISSITPYATPSEIMGDVRQKVLEIHGRKQLMPPK